MKEPKYFICAYGNSYHVVKKVKSNYYLWPRDIHTGMIRPRIDGHGYLADGLRSISFKNVICTATSKNQALSFATHTYLAKHHPEYLI